ncbi:hypothetical protein CR513_05779, partial [Mucuna pruriens]
AGCRKELLQEGALHVSPGIEKYWLKIQPILRCSIQGEWKCLHFDVVLRYPLRPHCRANHMKFFKMLVGVFSCKTMKFWQQTLTHMSELASAVGIGCTKVDTPRSHKDRHIQNQRLNLTDTLHRLRIRPHLAWHTKTQKNLYPRQRRQFDNSFSFSHSNAYQLTKVNYSIVNPRSFFSRTQCAQLLLSVKQIVIESKVLQQEKIVPLPFPNRTISAKKLESDEKLLRMF